MNLERAKEIAEIGAIAGITLLPFVWFAIKRVPMGANSRRILLASAVFFTLHGVAQVTTRHQYHFPQKAEPFPFTRWAMFAGFKEPLKDARVQDWRGVREDGSSEALNPARLFRTPNAVVLFTRTQSLAGDLDSGNPELVAAAKMHLKPFATGILRRANLMNQERPFVRVELWQRRIELRGGVPLPERFEAPQSQMVFSEEGGQP